VKANTSDLVPDIPADGFPTLSSSRATSAAMVSTTIGLLAGDLGGI